MLQIRLSDLPKKWDMIVIGGGISGAGIFHESTKLGIKTLLLEQNDFAWGTSSRSSKLVHGGFRYLGQGRLGLTRTSVVHRQRLIKEAPGLVEPWAFFCRYLKISIPANGCWDWG
jgi:glycerol-3-phosphate dehydrogenase